MVRLTATVVPQKYAIVIVKNEDGTVNREVRLTGDEYRALAAPQAIPRGVTSEEWISGRAVAIGKDFDVGDIVASRGTVTLKSSERQVNGETVETFLQFKPTEWTGTFPDITVDSATLATLPVGRRPASIIDGVLT